MRYVAPLPDIVLNFPIPTGIRKLIFQLATLLNKTFTLPNQQKKRRLKTCATVNENLFKNILTMS